VAIIAQTVLSVQIAAGTTGGTAPGGATAPTGCTLSSPTEIGAWITSVANAVDVATLDATTFGSGGYVAMVAGLKSGTLSLTIDQDWAASAPDALLGLNGSVIAVGGTGFVEIKPTTGARSATNPAFICKIINKGWKPFSAGVGQIATVQWDVQITGGFAELIA
jgi:hypothetical protein